MLSSFKKTLRKFFNKNVDPWWVTLDRGLITVRDPSAKKRSVHLDDISAVVVMTNGKGPIEDDVWWVLYGKEEEPVQFPMGIIGDSSVVDELVKFKGFDHKTMAEAMCSTKDHLFTLWERGWDT